MKLASKEQHEVFENGGVRALYIGVKEVRVRHLRLCVSLGKLVTIHPDAVRYLNQVFNMYVSHVCIFRVCPIVFFTAKILLYVMRHNYLHFLLTHGIIPEVSFMYLIFK